MKPILSVVIPAHNEGSLLGRLLSGIAPESEDAPFEVVVVANGCTDDTADRARSFPGVRVVEIAEASKIAALNAGDRAATVFPRVYVDADVDVARATLEALAVTLTVDGPHVASPRLKVDTSGSSWLVRRYYEVWALSEYRAKGHIGSGIYGLSRTGRERFVDFPDVIADDRFVQQQFAERERTTLHAHVFTVESPRDIRSLVRRSSRIVAGNRQLEASPISGEVAEPALQRYLALVRRVARRPRLWPAFPIYLVGFAVIQIRAQRLARGRGKVAWSQDLSTRRT